MLACNHINSLSCITRYFKMLFSFWIDSSAFAQFPLAVTDVQVHNTACSNFQPWGRVLRIIHMDWSAGLCVFPIYIYIGNFLHPISWFHILWLTSFLSMFLPSSEEVLFQILSLLILTNINLQNPVTADCLKLNSITSYLPV